MKNRMKFFVIAIALTTALKAQTSENLITTNCSAHQWNRCGSSELKTTVLYTGQWLRIPFQITTGSDSLVIFAELSNASGSFSTPTVIGTFTMLQPGDTRIEGVIKATIPENLELSNAYRIRLVSNKGAQVQIVLSNITMKSMNIWFADFDGDGFGDPAKSFVSIKDTEPGFVQNGNDSDDSVFNTIGEITGIMK